MDEALFTTNNLWMLVATVLVFLMHLGFASLEAGFVRRKNTVNILFKNAMIIAIGLLIYCFCGFNLMYPGFNEGGFFAFSHFGLQLPEGADGAIAYADGAYTYYTDFIFQAMFAATAATIVSGAVAERMKLESFLLFSAIFVAVSYPITGFWKWGGGWLNSYGFYDFAGSTLVHAVGGFAALAAVIVLGPRNGKYTSRGIQAIPGHSMPLATLGVFLLWFGWFGFNGGSVLSANPAAVSLVFVTTALAAAAGAVGAFFASYLLFRTHDLSMVLNGILGGLVGITAGADQMGPSSAMLVGLVAGVLIPFAVAGIDRARLDDPVGAITVHGLCGIWGTLAVGLLGALAGPEQLLKQLVGVSSVGAFSFVFALLLMLALKYTIGIRVPAQHEESGLDMAEHDMHAYEEAMEDSGYALSAK